MADRAGTLLLGRRERLHHLLGHPLKDPAPGPRGPLSAEERTFLAEEAQDLYWNELEWENITDEEAMDDGPPLAELAFPGFLAFVRGLLLREVMPDALAPASPRPEVVEDVLHFLARRVVELEDSLDGAEGDERVGMERERAMAGRLIDLVLYRYHDLSTEEIERAEAGSAA